MYYFVNLIIRNILWKLLFLKRGVFFVIFFNSIIGILNAQGGNKINDGNVLNENIDVVVPYTYIREADVDYYKRVWREIDLREKLNHPLYYPIEPIYEFGSIRRSLFDVLKFGIEKKVLTPYEDYDFQVPLTQSEANDLLFVESVEYTEDLETGELTETTVLNPIGADQVTSYRIKEDWFFDRERSVLEVRILGIQPLINVIDLSTGETKGQKGLFWIYYPEARYILVAHKTFNTKNDGFPEKLNFEDLFRKRIFNSYIYQETNVYNNRRLDQHTKGIDRLIEARKIEQEIINYEHDLWQY